MVSSREVAKYGPNAADFVRSFGRSLTAQIPHDKWTSTALRAEKRNLEKMNAFAKEGIEAHQRGADANRMYNEHEEKIDPMKDVRARIQKAHPSWRMGQVLHAAHRDPVGRQIIRMRLQGLSNSEIRSKLKGSSKKGSTGHSGG